MKTSTIPSLRVSPELRASVEQVLREGETLSGFVEHAICASVEQRQFEHEFIARGLAARDNAHRKGVYIDADTVIDRLETKLKQVKADREITKP